MDFIIEFEEQETMNVDIASYDIVTSTNDHSQLINRDAANQHPISAITGLQTTLDNKQPKGNYLTKENTSIPSKVSELENDLVFVKSTDLPKIDTTLKQSGQAADAAATGKRISTLEDTISNSTYIASVTNGVLSFKKV